MKKTIFTSCILLLIIVGIYLNRSYAHIYDTIKESQLLAVNNEQEYIFGDSKNKKITYATVGDSLTAGVGVDSYKKSYPYMFADKISKKGDNVVLKTYAIPGARSIDISTQLLDDIIKSQPDIITLLIGVNDVHGNVSQKEFQSQYENILKKLTQQTQAKIYVVNIPYIGAPDLIRQPLAYYFDMKTRQFNTEIKNLADTYSVQYIDLYTPTLQVSKEDSYYASDLFHPSFEGYTLWAQILYDNFNY